MSAPVAKTATSGNGSSTDRSIDWANLTPTLVSHEDSMDPLAVSQVWLKMLGLAKLDRADETKQAAFRLAVYAYGCINGTSREGDYQGIMQLSDGTRVEASVIPKATGKMNIRRFFRGCMKESYEALKVSKVIENNERMVAKAAVFGVDPGCAFAMADWFSDCPYFTPSEKAAYDKSFVYALNRSRRARGGKSLEDVENVRLESGLQVQGRLDAPPESHSDF